MAAAAGNFRAKAASHPDEQFVWATFWSNTTFRENRPRSQHLNTPSFQSVSSILENIVTMFVHHPGLDSLLFSTWPIAFSVYLN